MNIPALIMLIALTALAVMALISYPIPAFVCIIAMVMVDTLDGSIFYHKREGK